jgi:GT2 family glycosyltransferase
MCWYMKCETNSKRTQIIKIIWGFIKKILKFNKYTHLFCKVLKCLKNNGFKFTLQKIKQKLKNTSVYGDYIKQNFLKQEERKIQINTDFSKKVTFSIVVPIYNTPKEYLCEMIDSSINQTYGNWELCLADGSDKEHSYVGQIIKNYMEKDNRIKYKVLDKNGGISENTNECIKMASGDYIALFDHDDLLHPAALFEYMKVICDNDADFIYCDEAVFEKNLSNIKEIHFKPNFAIDNLRVYNYICHFTVFKKDLLKQVGIFRKEFDGSQDHDMVLRLTEQAKTIVHIPKVLYYWRSHPESVSADINSKPYAIENGKKAVREHLKRCRIKGKVESSEEFPTIYRLTYDIEDEPLISILIPNKDNIKILSTCINSILEKSTYKNIEIIVIENNSTEKEIFEYYKSLDKYKNVKVVKYEANGEFNYSSINNFGAKYAKGEHLLFLNNDIEVISKNWLQEMLMYSQRKDIGAVGAKLYYANDTIQHAGVILGIGGFAGHSHRHIDRKSGGYFSRCKIQQNLSAVTAACLMMKKSVFNEINGFDETFKVALNDVDLCMRIRQAGYLIAWTPYTELYHYESISRGYEDTPEKQKRFQGEVKKFQDRWKKELEHGDPYYNPNLTLCAEDFSLKIN